MGNRTPTRIHLDNGHLLEYDSIADAWDCLLCRHGYVTVFDAKATGWCGDFCSPSCVHEWDDAS